MTEAARIMREFLNKVSSLDIEGIKSLFAENAGFETMDDRFAVAFAHADGVLANGNPYLQNYVFYVRLDVAGKISEYREYMNPQQLAKALAALGA